MSRHEGVSCDSCLKGNFRGRRYKCLVCYDYDLCAACYEAGATNTRHTTDHPMQCILTRSDFELYYGGEALTSLELPQSYTCPYCSRMGFTDITLQEHVTSDHQDTNFEVVCPLCAAMPGGDPNLMTDDFAGHLTLEHRTGPRDLISFLDEPVGTRHNVRRIPHNSNHATTHLSRGGTALRPRRSNMHFSVFSSGGLSSLSPSSRESVDPIAELLSQLSGVRRSASNTNSSTPTQLQQLQMQLQLERQQVNAARQQLERFPRRQASNQTLREPSISNCGTSTMMLNASPVMVQPSASLTAQPSYTSQFLLTSTEDLGRNEMLRNQFINEQENPLQLVPNSGDHVAEEEDMHEMNFRELGRNEMLRNVFINNQENPLQWEPNRGNHVDETEEMREMRMFLRRDFEELGRNEMLRSQFINEQDNPLQWEPNSGHHVAEAQRMHEMNFQELRRNEMLRNQFINEQENPLQWEPNSGNHVADAEEMHEMSMFLRRELLGEMDDSDTSVTVLDLPMNEHISEEQLVLLDSVYHFVEVEVTTEYIAEPGTSTSSAPSPRIVRRPPESHAFLLEGLLEELAQQSSNDTVRMERSRFVEELVISTAVQVPGSSEYLSQLIPLSTLELEDNPVEPETPHPEEDTSTLAPNAPKAVLRGRARCDPQNAKRRAEANKRNGADDGDR